MFLLIARKGFLQPVLPAALATICLLGLSACGGGGGGNNNLTPSISITPAQASVAIGLTAHFQAVVTNSNSGVTWEVNGIAGGNSAVGTIQGDASVADQGDYTAPSAVPSSNPVSVTAVLASNKNVVSNAASVSVTAAQGLAVSPASTTAAAGTTVTFTATLNGAPDTNATWSVSSPGGGDVGTIGASTGIYTPPLFPPPGAQVTVKAVDGSNSGTATVTVTYGPASLSGTYAFAYTGDDGSGFFTAAGSFATDGNGNITGGVEDAEDLGGVNSAVPISSGGTYTVSPDGATLINLTANGTPITLEAVLTTNLHGLLIRYDTIATGSGTIDQQTAADFGNINGPYVFSLSGADGIGPYPLAFAGKFAASAGTIPNTNAIVDVNDGGDVNGNCPSGSCNVAPGSPDTSLSGSYTTDQNNLSYGRGTLTLNATGFSVFTATSTTQVTFAYYVVDKTHLHLVEIDGSSFTGGDMYEGLTGTGFGVSILPKGNYAFSIGGTSYSNGAYAAGGVFASSGDGNVTGGIFDNNSGGIQINNGLTINQCAYQVDPATGRIDALLSVKSGNGCTTPSTSVQEFAVYQTALAQPSSVMVEIDNNFLTSGNSYAQQGSPAGPTGTFALNLTGQGAFRNTPASYQQDALGVLALTGTAASSGTFFVNNYGSVEGGPLVVSSSSLTAPSGTYGRGTAKLIVNLSPNATYTLVYYYIDPQTYLLIDLDTNRIANGVIADQF